MTLQTIWYYKGKFSENHWKDGHCFRWKSSDLRSILKNLTLIPSKVKCMFLSLQLMLFITGGRVNLMKRTSASSGGAVLQLPISGLVTQCSSFKLCQFIWAGIAFPVICFFRLQLATRAICMRCRRWKRGSRQGALEVSAGPELCCSARTPGWRQ